MNDKQITAEQVQREYERGKDYKNGLNLYESVKICERMVEGDQWAGLKVKQLRPITMNFLDPICYYKVAQIVSDDVGQEIEPFLPDEEAERAAKIIEQSIDRVVERQKIKAKHREILRDAFVDGDAALYFWFDADAKTGMDGVQGDIVAESIMNTNIIFGNPQSARVQRQPYIIIVQRVPVEEEKEKAKKEGVQDWESITGDSASEYKGEDELSETDKVCTKLTRFWKGEDGFVRFMQVIEKVVVKKETVTAMTRYPLAYMSWKPRKNSMHGVREIEPLINTQIAVNKQFTALGTQVLNNAMPKLVYNKQKFPDGWDAEAQTIGVTGDPTQALTGVAGSMPIPTDAFGITNNLLDTAKNVAGANDAALGNIKNPDNKGAIIAAQTATAAPLSLTRLSYYQFVEDYTRILIDMFHAYYGIRHVKTTETVTNPATGETSEQTVIKEYDFSQLPVDAMDLNINIGAASYWAETLQIATLDNLLNAHVIPNAVEYLKRLPENTVRDKAGLIDAIERVQQQAAQAQMMQQGGVM